MLSRTIFDQALRKIQVGGLTVHYWDGVTKTYGPEPYAEITIHQPRALRAILLDPPTGLGECYMDGSIDLTDIIAISRLAAENAAVVDNLNKIKLPRWRQPNRRRRQRRQIAHHYDLGNEFYSLWLDSSMTYSCGYYRNLGDTLERAQQQKTLHVLRKLQLTPGQSLLDVGCGWGQLLIAAAQQFGVTGYGITLSAEQHALAGRRVTEAGLAGKITIELCNYQDLAERGLTFDRVVSVGMYEHVGRGNHNTYFRALDQLLKPGGLNVLHTITAPKLEPIGKWTDTYIFPGGYLPTVAQTTKLAERHHYELQDYENLRYHYALTLEEWLRRFEAHKSEVIAMYDERFYRMWKFYLATSAAGFRYSGLTLSQFVLTKGPHPEQPLTREYLYGLSSDC